MTDTVRTRGRGSQLEGWTSPATSISDCGASSSASVGGVDALVGGVDAGEAVGFSEGPSDVSILVNYNHHVALRLWQGKVRLCYTYLLCLCCV